MKRFVCLIFGSFLFACAFAQTSSLVIAADKTTSLIFPFRIVHVDRGAREVIVQQVKEADHILLIKAGSPFSTETNLSVVTEDGNVYEFSIRYATNPSTLVWHIPAQREGTLSTYANGILDNPVTMHGIRDRSWDIEAKVTGIYIKDEVIYYQLRLENVSSIDYDIDLLKFYIRDQRKGKRTATQENEIVPLFVAGNVKMVPAHSYNVIVVALDKFTIPDAKLLAIQVMERNGGRHLLLRVHNHKIIKAIPLPDLR